MTVAVCQRRVDKIQSLIYGEVQGICRFTVVAAGKGTRYRATAVGPGVLPDVTWEGGAPGPYDPAVDRQLAALQREVYGADTLCKPV